jgi:hypothetical protein
MIKHNDIPLKLALESAKYNFFTKKTNKQNWIQDLIPLEDHELVNVFGKYIFSSYFVALPRAFKEQAQWYSSLTSFRESKL